MVNMPLITTAYVPNTCGELVQGIGVGIPYLVSCPIASFARVTVRQRADSLVRGPAERPRAVAAARATRAYVGRPEVGLDLTIINPLPAGRGFGTSTADIVGCIATTARLLGATLSPSEMARLAIGIEPSDSTMFGGLARLDHRGGSQWEPLGPAPALALVVLDLGGAVDTLAYNAALDLGRWSAQEATYARALALLRAGLTTGDSRLVSRAATQSALAHHRLFPTVALPAALALGQRVGAYGLCVAHSGTAFGLLLPPTPGLAARVATLAWRVLPGLAAVWPTRLVGGGVRFAMRPLVQQSVARQPAARHKIGE